MPDDPTKTANDSELISLEQEHEVRRWVQALGCTEDELHQVVKVVGHSASAVRMYLHGKQSAQP